MTNALRIQLWKETRALLPWWAGMTLSVAAAGLLARLQTNHESANTFMFALMFTHVAGCAGLGALSMGQEFSHRTLTGLLAQPIGRPKLLTIKMAVLAISLVTLVEATHLSVGWNQFSLINRDQVTLRVIVYGPPLAGFFLAPLLTMLSRVLLAGAVFSVAIPLAIMMTVKGFHLGIDAAWRVFFAVAGASGALTLWLFMRLPVLDGPRRPAAVTVLLERPMAPASDEPVSVSTTERSWLGHLARKELRLQQMTFVVAALFVVAWAATILARRFDPLMWPGLSHYALTGLHGAVIATLAGALPAAEERQHSTADWHMLLPVAAWKQWTLKAAISVAIAVGLAIGLPLFLGFVSPSPDDLSFDWEQLLPVIVLALTGLYVSSMSSTGLRALLAVFPVVGTGSLVLAMILQPLEGIARGMRGLGVAAVAPGTIDRLTYVQLMTTLFILVVAGLAALLFVFGFRNYRFGGRGREQIGRQFAWLMAYMVAGALTLAAVGALLGAAATPLMAR